MVSYIFYRNNYFGRMAEEEFLRIRIKAGAYIDRVTFGRVTESLPSGIQEQAKLALCSVADEMLLTEQGGPISAESNDGISVTYVASVSKVRSDAQRLQDAASLFLNDTGLMYRGCSYAGL